MAGPPPTSARGPRWLRLALAASLGANLVVAGIVIGRSVRPEPAGDWALTVTGLRHAVRTLPAGDRAAFRTASDSVARRLGPFREALVKDRDAFLAMLRAETFDAEAARRLMAGQNTRVAEATLLAFEEVIRALETLPPDARRRFAEAVERPRSGASEAPASKGPAPAAPAAGPPAAPAATN